MPLLKSTTIEHGSPISPPSTQSNQAKLTQANNNGQLNQLLLSSAQTGNSNQNIIQHTIHELEPMSRYSLRLVAVNAIGRSRPSIALNVRTDEEGE